MIMNNDTFLRFTLDLIISIRRYEQLYINALRVYLSDINSKIYNHKERGKKYLIHFYRRMNAFYTNAMTGFESATSSSLTRTIEWELILSSINA